MIFARYKGADKAGEKFTPGKVYFGTPNMDDSDIISMDFVTIKDEIGKKVRVIPAEDRFEFLDEVYAAVLNPFDEFYAGDVVILDDGEINGDIYVSVKGCCLRKASDVVVLDRTNVYPNVIVQEICTGKWTPLLRVDECLWVVLQGADPAGFGFRQLTEFRFAISYDGDIMSMPLVKCLDASGVGTLTEGKTYQLVSNDEQGNYLLKNDAGKVESYLPSRFRMG